jgi:hypothetical protein
LKRRPRVRTAAEAAEDRKEDYMEFLLSHWHCIVPVIAIGVVIFLEARK